MNMVVPANLAGQPTPFLVAHRSRLVANIAAMQRRVEDLDAQIRPHIKCHRTHEIAQIQVAHGAIGFACSTVAQAELANEVSGEGVLVTSPVYLDRAVSLAVHALQNRSHPITFVVESCEGVQRLRTMLPDHAISVVIEIECGTRRTGVAPDEIGALLRAATRVGVDVIGVMTYPGNAYRPGMAQMAVDQERTALERGVLELERAGSIVSVISAGSTPTMRLGSKSIATEYRPGTYVFGDCQQFALGAVSSESIAGGVVATVISVHRDRVILDAGAKALGRDSPRWLEGYGRIGSPSGDLLTRLFDHHAVCDAPRRKYGLGDRVVVIPNNINSAVNLHSVMYLQNDDGAIERLQVARD